MIPTGSAQVERGDVRKLDKDKGQTVGSFSKL